MFERLKTKTVYLTIILSGVVLVVVMKRFDNNFIYPDSFTYLLNNQSDYFVAIKPLASTVLRIVYSIGLNIQVLNVALFAGAIMLIYKSATILNPKLKVSLAILTSLLLMINGNVIYWIGRYGSEFPTIFLASLSIYLLIKKKKFSFGLVFTALVLVRPEFILILPILSELFNLKKFKWGISLPYLLFAFTTALMRSELILFVLNILLPLILIEVVLFITQRYNLVRLIENRFELIRSTVGITTLFIVTIYLATFLSGTTLPTALQGIASVVILNVGLIGLLIFAFGKTNVRLQLSLIGVILVLSTVYAITAIDSFRYFLYIMPFFQLLTLTSEEKTGLSHLFLVVAQLLLLLVVVPLKTLESNYWHDRFAILNNYDREKYIVYSGTPLISELKGYLSINLCEIKSDQIIGPAVILVDGYTETTCPEVLEFFSLYELKPDHEITTPDFVELERYKNLGQTTKVYSL